MLHRLSTCLAGVLTIAVLTVAVPASAQLPDLRVSDNKRVLVTSDGTPFFWLGDTAWELFHRLNREEAERYLDDRARKGFTVIQAVALAELDGLGTPNPYGHVPLVDRDPTRPAMTDGLANDYWDHVDHIVDRANAKGLYVGLLPTWGDKWNKKWGVGPEVFTPQNAEAYGEWLGRRYGDRGVIWIVGGDRPLESDAHRAIVEAMARGLRRETGDAGSSPSTRWADRARRSTSTTPTGSTSTCARTAITRSSPKAFRTRAWTTTARP